MKITYSYVKNPVRITADAYNCIVKFDHLPDEVEFTASRSDVEPHGREIFARCDRGDFGEARFEPLPSPEPAKPILPEHLAYIQEMQPFLDDANRENETGSERGGVLVWGAILDVLLDRIIRSCLAPDTSAQDALFNIEGAYGFSAKIKLAYLLSAITDDERSCLDTIRKIRNDFAHRLDQSLENGPNRDRVTTLYSALCDDGAKFDGRLSFSMSCGRMMIVLGERLAAARVRAPLVALADERPLSKRGGSHIAKLYAVRGESNEGPAATA